MSFTWSPEQEPPRTALTRAGRLRAGLRATAIVAVLIAGVGATLPLRLLERPLFGSRRPWTPVIAQSVWRAVFVILRMRHETAGAPMARPGAVVANHTSWLDIPVLNARDGVFFVAKSEVAGWPVIGALARLGGTVFIARDRRHARTHRRIMADRLKAGHKLLFFPEGTSTDGLRVLPFKSTLFEAFFDDELRPVTHIQPVSVIYRAPPGEDPRFYGWWGDMDLAPHLLQVLAVRRNGSVRVVWHEPVPVADFAGRKTLARHVEAVVRAGLPPERRLDG